MTTKPKAFDKTDQPLEEGDTVELVYGGDTHIAKVDKIYEDLGSIVIVATVPATVISRSVRKVDPKTKKPDNSRRRSAD
jgi:hypothetical protein